MNICKSCILAVSLLTSGASFAVGQVIVIDPGHEPSKSGAKGTCGESEVIYNDLMAQKLKASLTSYKVILTRQPGKEIKVDDKLALEVPGVSKNLWSRNKSLIARPALANAAHADVFISIHHDSVSKKHQTKHAGLCDGKGGITVSDAFRHRYKIGYNVFVNNDAKEPIRSKSIKLAKIIGKQMIAIGRTPSDYHFFPVDDCKSCEPVDKKLGVWHHDLAVLRHAEMPSVLIEIGNIIDHEDEAQINTDEFRQSFSDALRLALDQFIS